MFAIGGPLALMLEGVPLFTHQLREELAHEREAHRLEVESLKA